VARIVTTKGRELATRSVSHAEAVARCLLTAEQMKALGWTGSPGFLGRGAMRVARSEPGYTNRKG
jgi:hypothetical protein